MDQQRFDALTRAISTRFSRRAAVQAAGLLGTAAAVGANLATAQEATPQATPASDAPARFLYVQTFGAGTLAPAPDEPGHFLLTLADASGSTIAFADRPSRLTDVIPTERLPAALGFDSANPPNAALLTHADSGEELVAIIELLEPTYDSATQTATYLARELADYRAAGADLVARAQPPGSLPASFGRTSLFIDSGGDGCNLQFADDCSSGGTCCPDNTCISVTVTANDPSQTRLQTFGMGMCMPVP